MLSLMTDTCASILTGDHPLHFTSLIDHIKSSFKRDKLIPHKFFKHCSKSSFSRPSAKIYLNSVLKDTDCQSKIR